MRESTPYALFVFGIYPGGDAGSDSGLVSGPPGNPLEIERCLAELQGESRPFVLRAYERFSDRDNPSRWPTQTPRNYERYLHSGRLLDLVIMYQSESGDIQRYVDFACEVSLRLADRLYSVQVTEEASFTDGPDAIDGPYPGVQEALVQGVIAVKDVLRRAGHSNIRVGFNSTPTFGEKSAFWANIGSRGGREFLGSVDYVGLDFFPDVFRPAAPDGQPGDIRDSVVLVLETMRNQWLPACGIRPLIPIDVAEHGWPTGPARSYERQARAIETVIRTVWELRERLNIARYTLFDLRDADSSTPEVMDDIFHHFGITRDDYVPKPAYQVFRQLIGELGPR